ncbi:hypothetical protein BJV82DRAFT_582384 [Fennellomyces sp. T-0311]|nr:hypothetical protein BJV82DRAFT_582384 [Fennellomyces sp. T-0311]
MSNQEVELTDSIGRLRTAQKSKNDELHTARNGQSNLNHDRESSFSIENQVLLRDLRAAASGNVGLLEKQILEAEKAIRTTPTSPIGYLQAGKLYSLLGYQQRAMGVYEQGIANVCNQHHNALQQGYDEAKAKDEQCVDFLARAPYDIVASIVKSLSLKDRISLLQVSRRWRGQLLEWESLWSVLEIDDEDGFTVADLSLLHNVDHFVYNISLVCLSHNLCAFLLSGIEKGRFSRLEGLSLYMKGIDLAVVEDILRCCPALRNLHILYCSSLVVKTVHRYCKNLVSFAINIEGLPKLQVLVCGLTYSDEQDMRNLFYGLASKGKELTLREVSFASIGSERFPFSTVLLEYLPIIPTLQEVDVRNCTVTEKLLNAFCERMQNHPCIEYIILTNLDKHVTDTTLKHLAAIKTLKHLELSYLNGITEQGLQIFNDSPITLSVWDCSGTTDRTAPLSALSIYN